MRTKDVIVDALQQTVAERSGDAQEMTTLSAQPPPERALDRLNRVIGYVANTISALAVIVLMIHVMVNVVARTYFNAPLAGTLEITQFWYMPLLALFGIVGAQVRRENLRADLLFGRLSRRVRVVLAIMANIISAAVCAAFAYFSWESSIESLARNETAGISNLIIWPVTFAVPSSFALLAILFAIQIFLQGLADVDSSEEAATMGEAAVPISMAVDRGASPATRSRGGFIMAAALVGTVLTSAIGVFLPLPKEAVGLIALLMMLGLLFLRVPIAIALIVPSILGIWGIRGFSPAEGMLSNLAYTATASWSLSVIAMFVFLGLLVWRAGVTADIYAAARNWLKWMPGGLAVGTNVAGAGLSAVSGSTVGQVYALARIGVPEMLRAGYRPRYAISAVISSGLTGQLIPPSILLVIYAGIAEVSVGHQLIAGVVPGLLILLLLVSYFVIRGILRPEDAGRGPKASFPTGAPSAIGGVGLWRSLFRTWPVALLLILVIGGMFSGVLTATEVGAATALFAVLLALGRERSLKGFSTVGTAAMEAARSTGAIFFLIIGGTALTRMLTLSGVSTGLADALADANLTPFVFMLIMLVVYLVMGMFLDPLAMMLLTVPILMPTLDALGISLLFFGVFVVFLGELAIVTPPVGMLSYVVHGVVQDKEVNFGQPISLRDVFAGVLAILPICLLFLILLILFPQIATFAPDLMTQISNGSQ